MPIRPRVTPVNRARAKQHAWETIIPNRFADVDAICRAHPEAFPPGDANDPSRLKLLVETMVPEINAAHPEDNGNWGVLTKTDQNGKIPCDVMVWRPGTVTVDVMTGTGASWDVHGAANNPARVWTPCAAEEGGGEESGEGGGVGEPFDNDKAVEFGLMCNDVYTESGASPDAGMISVHSQRCAYDYYVNNMPWDACLEKHTNAFRAEYQLPPI